MWQGHSGTCEKAEFRVGKCRIPATPRHAYRNANATERKSLTPRTKHCTLYSCVGIKMLAMYVRRDGDGSASRCAIFIPRTLYPTDRRRHVYLYSYLGIHRKTLRERMILFRVHGAIGRFLSVSVDSSSNSHEGARGGSIRMLCRESLSEQF